MILDTSVLLAILFKEEDSAFWIQEIQKENETGGSVRMSVASYLEATLRVHRLPDPKMGVLLEELVTLLGVTLEPVDEKQIQIAREADKVFGKGLGQKPGLNYGDLFSYALARSKLDRLAYKGDDFSITGIRGV